jgi:leucyl aminopeptidase
MHTGISLNSQHSPKQDIVVLLEDVKQLPKDILTKEEINILQYQHKELKKEMVCFHRNGHNVLIQLLKEEKDLFKRLEACRKAGEKVVSQLNGLKVKEVQVIDAGCKAEDFLGFTEGMVLGNYQFTKYLTSKEKNNTVKKVTLVSTTLPKERVDHLAVVTKAVTLCRSLINEPLSYLTAEIFSKEVEKLGKECGAKVEVMNKAKIAALKMGGILAVNKASNEPPTFTVMEWKPKGAVNKKPFIFVGKGVVFDTGGMNLKPGDSMLNMKDDMSGAAAVACAIYAISMAKLPVHVIGLMPATDNKIGPKAVVPGDIISMYDGTTVEVINTDAEGRLILADALSYAAKYKPELVIDLATLTGSAVRAIGKFGIVAMQSDAKEEMAELTRSGWNVYERLVEFPFWDEYGELIKSDIADLKNLGPGEAGSITAGKFLQHFTKYPYIHLDIAGPAFVEKRDSYRGAGGTGVGVRLLFDFVKGKVKS